MSLSKYQKEVLVAELKKPEYVGMTAEQAHDFLHKAERDRTPRIAQRFSGKALREAGFPTLLGWTESVAGGEKVKVSLSMPNAIDQQEFAAVFKEVRGKK